MPSHSIVILREAEDLLRAAQISPAYKIARILSHHLGVDVEPDSSACFGDKDVELARWAIANSPWADKLRQAEDVTGFFSDNFSAIKRDMDRYAGEPEDGSHSEQRSVAQMTGRRAILMKA